VSDICPTCKKYTWNISNLPHKCPPIMTVWESQYPEDTSEYYEVDPQYAAEAFAEEWDQDEHTLLGGTELTVHVQDDEGKVTRWTVTGEAVPQYSATEDEK